MNFFFNLQKEQGLFFFIKVFPTLLQLTEIQSLDLTPPLNKPNAIKKS